MKKLLSLIVLSLLMMTGLAWAQTYLINEGFESTTFPPTGWTRSGTNVAKATNNPKTGAACAAFKGKDAYLYTPILSNPNELSFYYRRSSNNTAWTLKVQVSSNATNWNDMVVSQTLV